MPYMTPLPDRGSNGRLQELSRVFKPSTSRPLAHRYLIQMSRIFDHHGHLLPFSDLETLGFQVSRRTKGKDLDSLLPQGWRAIETIDPVLRDGPHESHPVFLDVRDARNIRRGVVTFSDYDSWAPNLVLFPRMVLDRQIFPLQGEDMTQFILHVGCDDGRQRKVSMGSPLPLRVATAKVLHQTEEFIRESLEKRLPGWQTLTAYWDVPVLTAVRGAQEEVQNWLAPRLVNLEKASAARCAPAFRGSSTDNGSRPDGFRTKEGRPLVDPEFNWNPAAAETGVMNRLRSSGLGIFAPAEAV